MHTPVYKAKYFPYGNIAKEGKAIEEDEEQGFGDFLQISKPIQPTLKEIRRYSAQTPGQIKATMAKIADKSAMAKLANVEMEDAKSGESGESSDNEKIDIDTVNSCSKDHKDDEAGEKTPAVSQNGNSSAKFNIADEEKLPSSQFQPKTDEEVIAVNAEDELLSDGSY